jgi:hypothetical protein
MAAIGFSGRPLTMLSFFESRNLMKHTSDTSIKPPIPTAFQPHYTPSDEEEMRYEKAEERLEKSLAREGMVKFKSLLLYQSHWL